MTVQDESVKTVQKSDAEIRDDELKGLNPYLHDIEQKETKVVIVEGKNVRVNRQGEVVGSNGEVIASSVEQYREKLKVDKDDLIEGAIIKSESLKQEEEMASAEIIAPILNDVIEQVEEQIEDDLQQKSDDKYKVLEV